MRIAKDGKAFDIDDLPNTEPEKEEVEVIQFLKPEGKRRRALAPVGEEYAKLAENMVLSAEELQTGELAIYVKYQDEPAEKEMVEIAENNPGESSPTETLKRLIKFKTEENEQPPMDEETADDLKYHALKDEDRLDKFGRIKDEGRR